MRLAPIERHSSRLKTFHRSFTALSTHARACVAANSPYRIVFMCQRSISPLRDVYASLFTIARRPLTILLPIVAILSVTNKQQRSSGGVLVVYPAGTLSSLSWRFGVHRLLSRSDVTSGKQMIRWSVRRWTLDIHSHRYTVTYILCQAGMPISLSIRLIAPLL